MPKILYLYAIRREDTREVKIGVSIEPRARLAQIQMGNAHPLTLAFAVPCERRDERDAHARFAAHRRSGEWFAEAPEITAWIDEQLARCPTIPLPLMAQHLAHGQCQHDTRLGVPCTVPAHRAMRVRVAGTDDGFLWMACSQHYPVAILEFHRAGLLCEVPNPSPHGFDLVALTYMWHRLQGNL